MPNHSDLPPAATGRHPAPPIPVSHPPAERHHYPATHRLEIIALLLANGLAARPLPPAYGLGDGAIPPEDRQDLPVVALHQLWQDGTGMNESGKQFSFTRAASSTSGHAKNQIRISKSYKIQKLVMTKSEKQSLETVIRLMSGKSGDCCLAWKLLCNLAGCHGTQPWPPFDKSVVEEQKKRSRSPMDIID